MNKNQYRLVFSKKLDMLVAVAEITSAQGKAIGSAALTGIGLGGGLLGLSLAISNVFAQTSLLSTNILPTAPTTTVGLATYAGDTLLEAWFPSPALSATPRPVDGLGEVERSDDLRGVRTVTVTAAVADLSAAPADALDAEASLSALLPLSLDRNTV